MLRIYTNTICQLTRRTRLDEVAADSNVTFAWEHIRTLIIAFPVIILCQNKLDIPLDQRTMVQY